MKQKIAAFYAIFVGLSMIGMWSKFYLAGQIPELATRPFEIAMHIAAELLSSTLLLVGGGAILFRKNWGTVIYSVSMGMLLYSLIASPGYYLQRGNAGFVAMFAVLFVLSVLSLILMSSARSPSDGV